MQMVFISECISCEISNQMFLNVILSISKRKKWTGYDKHSKIKLFSGAISRGGASNEPDVYLDPS